MNLEQAMKYNFEDIVDNKEKKKRFSNKEAAHVYSEGLKPLHTIGIGGVYGAFCSPSVNNGEYWWEVVYEFISIQHTPGPWVFHEQGEANQYCMLTNDKRWVIAFAQNGEILTEEQNANARLMSAAPDLLQAAINAKAAIEGMILANHNPASAVIKMLDDAINKATKQ